MEKPLIINHIYDKHAGILRIRTGERIDSGNAVSFGQVVTTLRQTCPGGRIIFDLEDLKYLSSMGLRVFLKLSKTEKNRISVVNVSPEVEDIFRMTGFDTFFDLSRKMRRVSLDGCAIIGRGANGMVYRLNPDTIIKVFRPDADFSVVEREREKARAALLKGLPTAISYDVVQVGDSYGIVFEMIGSKSLADVLKEDEAHFDRYAKAYSALYKEIHSTEGDVETFGREKDIYEEAIEYCSDVYTPQELEKLRLLVRNIPERTTLIHGDFHPKNIMLIDGELALIDMGDVSTGHPVFDFLATAATQVNLLKLDPAFAEQFTGMSAPMISRLWKSLMEDYFAGKSTDEIRQIDHRITGFSKLKVALAPYFARDLNEAVLHASIQDARTNLLPIIDELARGFE